MPELHANAPFSKLASYNCNKATSVRRPEVKYSKFCPQHSRSDSRHDEQDSPVIQNSVRGERHHVGMWNTSDGHGHDG